MSKVVAFGETMIRLSTIRKERLEQSQYLEIRSAGAESNFCIGCSQMGIDALWVSKLTNNPLGRAIVNNLRRYGVSTYIVWTNDYRVGTYYIEYGSFPRSTQVIYDRDDSAIRYIDPQEIDWTILDDADLVHLTGITVALGKKAKNTLKAFIAEAKKRNALLSFDVNYRSKLWSPEIARAEISEILNHSFNYLFIGLSDARTVFDVKGGNEEIAKWLKERFNPEMVILTLGSKGALAYDGESFFKADTQPSDTVDPIGSGDAFDAAFISSILKGNNVEESLKIGNSLAAFKRTIVGDEPIFSYQEVLNLANVDDKGIVR